MNHATNRAGWGSLLTSAAGVLLATTSTLATAQQPGQTPQERYQADRAACLSGNTNQDRTTCLREAGAALHDARQGKLDNGAQGQYQRNAEMRCAPLPLDQRQSCLLRMEGEGRTSGSVAGGGIYRELRQIVPADDPNATTLPATSAPGTVSPGAVTPSRVGPTSVIIIPAEPPAETGEAPQPREVEPPQPVVPLR